MVSGVAFTSLGISQELPGVMPTDMLDKAIREQASGRTIDDGQQPSLPTKLLWVVGFGVAALGIGRLRSSLPQWVGRAAGADATLLSADVASSGPEEANVVRSRPNKPRKPPEELKLPPHVLALLKKSAAARAAGRAALPSQSGGDPQGRGGLDVTLPSYDPWRDED